MLAIFDGFSCRLCHPDGRSSLAFWSCLTFFGMAAVLCWWGYYSMWRHCEYLLRDITSKTKQKQDIWKEGFTSVLMKTYRAVEDCYKKRYRADHNLCVVYGLQISGSVPNCSPQIPDWLPACAGYDRAGHSASGVSLINTKIGSYSSSTVTYNCNDFKACSLYGWLARSWKPSWDRLWVSHWLSISCPPPPPRLTGWYEERTITTKSRQKILQYSVLRSQGSVMAKWFSHHYQHHCQHLTLQHPWERVSWFFLLGCHTAYLAGFLAAYSHFLPFIWVSLATAHAVQPPCLTTTKTIWPNWTRAW